MNAEDQDQPHLQLSHHRGGEGSTGPRLVIAMVRWQRPGRSDPGSGPSWPICRAGRSRWVGRFDAYGFLGGEKLVASVWPLRSTPGWLVLDAQVNRNPQESIPRTRERLRGYSWLTIAAQEVGERLGGVPAIAATGAFAEVEPLAGGGIWLLATKDFRGYGMTTATAVFRALTPALPPGLPRARDDQGQPPTSVVVADPAQE